MRGKNLYSLSRGVYKKDEEKYEDKNNNNEDKGYGDKRRTGRMGRVIN